MTSAATKLPAQMNAICIEDPGGPEVMKLGTLQTPAPGKDQVLIKVSAAGVNRPDVVQRLGFYPAPPGAPETLGLEISGTLVALGEGATGFSLGDEVTALVAGGGYAEYCVADAPLVLPVPKGFSMVEAAALPETFFTVWTNVFDRGGLKSGETILIHGGSSGIGTTAIQLAAARGATVYATAGSAQKCKACRDLGAERAINYKEEDFLEVIQSQTNGAGVDVILDMVGADYIERNIACLALNGRLVNIAFLNGPKAEVNFMPVMLKRLTLTGSTLRPRSVAEKAQIAKSLKSEVWPLLDQAKIKPIIDSVFPLSEASKAHSLMESSGHIGKIILTP
jgi:putative PIG3 family NAD(P)H quinone oxidoreductase